MILTKASNMLWRVNLPSGQTIWTITRVLGGWIVWRGDLGVLHSHRKYRTIKTALRALPLEV